MVKIVFVESNGQQTIADVPIGHTVMEAARNNNIDGIVAECGGACACATCHAYIDPGWVGKIPPISPAEQDVLEFALDTDPVCSRLTCQITVSDELDGLIVKVPEMQM